MINSQNVKTGAHVGYLLGLIVALFTVVYSAFPIVGITSWYMALLPMVGLLGNSASIISLLCMGLFRFMKIGYVSTYGIPTYYASFYMSNNNALVRILVPLACMALFVAHPTGYDACWYSLYWLIPVAVYILRPAHFFYQALATTFVAHAVGSLLWLYQNRLSADQWLALIPQVIVERTVTAAAMTLAYLIAIQLSFYASKIFKRGMARITQNA